MIVRGLLMYLSADPESSGILPSKIVSLIKKIKRISNIFNKTASYSHSV
jgi:hypothetical protein